MFVSVLMLVLMFDFMGMLLCEPLLRAHAHVYIRAHVNVCVLAPPQVFAHRAYVCVCVFPFLPYISPSVIFSSQTFIALNSFGYI